MEEERKRKIIELTLLGVNPISPHEVDMYEDVLKTTLTKDNFELLKKYELNRDRRFLAFAVKMFHALNRNKEKFNKFVELLFNPDETIKTFDDNLNLKYEALLKTAELKRAYLKKRLEELL